MIQSAQASRAEGEAFTDATPVIAWDAPQGANIEVLSYSFWVTGGAADPVASAVLYFANTPLVPNTAAMFMERFEEPVFSFVNTCSIFIPQNWVPYLVTGIVPATRTAFFNVTYRIAT